LERAAQWVALDEKSPCKGPNIRPTSWQSMAQAPCGRAASRWEAVMRWW